MRIKEFFKWPIFWIGLCIFIISGFGLLNLTVIDVTLNHDYQLVNGDTKVIVNLMQNEGEEDLTLSHLRYIAGELEEENLIIVELDDGKIYEVTIVDNVKTRKIYGTYSAEKMTLSSTEETLTCYSTLGLRIALIILTTISFLVAVGFFIFIEISKIRQPINGIEKKLSNKL